jgi:hypothetical protein
MGGRERVDPRVRTLLSVIAAAQALLALGYIFQVTAVTALFPFPGTTPMSNIFIGSILAAAAASTLWCVWARSERALAGIAIDYLTILGPAALVAVLGVIGGAGLGMAAFGGLAVAGAAFGVWLLRHALRHEWRDPRPVPRVVRASFMVFIVALVIVGGLLVLRVPNVMPWTITPEQSTLFGLMFLGAAAYFGFGLREPRWENAAGQLAGFLAYDAVLILPFLLRIPTIDDALRLNLLIYTAVVVVSGVIAFWYLFLDHRTRLVSPPAASDPAEAATG